MFLCGDVPSGRYTGLAELFNKGYKGRDCLAYFGGTWATVGHARTAGLRFSSGSPPVACETAWHGRGLAQAVQPVTTPR